MLNNTCKPDCCLFTRRPSRSRASAGTTRAFADRVVAMQHVGVSAKPPDFEHARPVRSLPVAPQSPVAWPDFARVHERAQRRAAPACETCSADVGKGTEREGETYPIRDAAIKVHAPRGPRTNVRKGQALAVSFLREGMDLQIRMHFATLPPFLLLSSNERREDGVRDFRLRSVRTVYKDTDAQWQEWHRALGRHVRMD